MRLGEAVIKEIYVDSSARLLCPPELLPNPGQYLLADMRRSDSPVATPVFLSESTPEGFRSAPAIPSTWMPGAHLAIRGPIGHGFATPPAARKIALIAYDDSPARLRGLIPLSFKQGAEIVLLCNSPVNDLPESIEVQPLQALTEVLKWTDFIAADVARENFQQFKTLLSGLTLPETQILIRAPMPCGALAECGVCALTIDHQWKMVCKDGPVFRIEDLK
jgi:hypothetical protein